MYLVVRSAGDAALLAETLRHEVQSIDPGATLAQIGTMEQALDLSVSRPRFNTRAAVSVCRNRNHTGGGGHIRTHRLLGRATKA